MYRQMKIIQPAACMEVKYEHNKIDGIITACMIVNQIKYVMQFDQYGDQWIVFISSGRKRRELDVFEDKESKSGNGWEIVKWAVECIKQFPEKGLMTIYPADARRKRIYSRFLLPLGFRYNRYDGNMCYMKRLK